MGHNTLGVLLMVVRDGLAAGRLMVGDGDWGGTKKPRAWFAPSAF